MKFVHPALLFAIGLIAIPVFIHLFNLRRYKIIYFSNVRFLKNIKEETRKQSRLKHLLVLFSRILAIIFLILAFAQPYLPDKTDILLTDKDYISLYIDNSFSMEANGVQGKLLSLAEKKAAEIAESYRTTDAFQVLDNSFSASSQRLLSKEEVHDFIKEVYPAYHFRTLSEVVERQLSIQELRNYKQKFLYIISDFQKNFTNIENIKTDSTVKIFLVPVFPNESGNLYIDSCWFETPVKRLDQNVVLKAHIVNQSVKSVEKAPVKLTVNGRQRALSSFDIQPNSDIVVELPYKINEAGIHQVCVEINDYPVTYDDKFYISYTVMDKMPLLCINNDKENIYLNALFGKDSAFEFQNIQGKAIDYSRLNNYSLIILNEFNDISSGLSNELSRYLREGGQLLLIPGKDIDKESFNAFLSETAAATLGAADTQKVKINNIDFSHPLYNDVFDKIPENINLPEVKKYYPINIRSKAAAVNLLSLQNNLPFLSVFNVNKGLMYIMASPLNKEFTNFPIYSIFVPTLYNMALYSTAQRNLFYTLGKDNAIEFLRAGNVYDEIFKIKKFDSDFEFIPQFSSAFSSFTCFINDQITEAGNYYLCNKKDTLGGLSYNYNRNESDMSYIYEEALEERIKSSGINNVFLVDTRRETVRDAVAKINKGVVMWKYCIILALLFLLAEILLLRFWK